MTNRDQNFVMTVAKAMCEWYDAEDVTPGTTPCAACWEYAVDVLNGMKSAP